MFKALVVDDEPHVRDLTCRALRKRSIDCDAAADGDEALELYEQESYQAVITDLRMPRRHGHSLAVELLRRPEAPHVLVVTGLAEPRLVQDLVSRGVEEVLYKPVNYDVLAMKVQAVAARLEGATGAKPVTREQPSSHQILMTIEKSLVELTEIFQESLEGVFDLDDDLSDPPKAVNDFVKRFAEQEEAEVSTSIRAERQAERVICRATAIAVPVTRRFARDGEPFKVAIRDLSESGIRLLHTRATNAGYLALKWTADTLPATRFGVVAKLMRCQPLSPFYDIGGQFVLAD